MICQDFSRAAFLCRNPRISDVKTVKRYTLDLHLKWPRWSLVASFIY